MGKLGWYNTWVFIDNLQLQPKITLLKTSDPSGPLHEGDTITYTIAYANTSLTTQTLTITDPLPFNTSLIPDSVSWPGTLQGSTLGWTLGDIPPGGSGQVSFAMRVPLLPSLHPAPAGMSALATGSSGYALPVSIACDTTHFWANGITVQPSPPATYTLHVQLPADHSLSRMWLLLKETTNISPTLNGQPATLITTTHASFGASLWSADLTPAMLADGRVDVVAQKGRNLDALFLFDRADPPFDETTLTDFFRTTKTFTYTFDVPSVIIQPLDVILPLMDINYLTDTSVPLPDNRVTTITMEFAGQHHTSIANDPNLGNGLLLVQTPFDLGSIPGAITGTRTLTLSVETEDSLYMLAPRICRPIYIENTAWLCSQQAGCISASVRNVPINLSYPFAVYFPIIMKP